MGHSETTFTRRGRGVLEEMSTNVNARYPGFSFNVNVDIFSKAIPKRLLKVCIL